MFSYTRLFQSIVFLGTFLMMMQWQAVLAMQVKHPGKTGEIHAIISQDDISRILVEDDTIIDLRVNEGALDDVVLQEITGSVFIRPSLRNGTRPVSLFITTANQKTYHLLLSPMDVPSEQIKIVNNDIAHTHHRLLAGEAYKQSLIRLYRQLQHAIKDNTIRLVGYKQIYAARKHPPFKLGKEVEILPYAVYEASPFKATIYQIRNKGTSRLVLHESQFASPHTVSVKLDKRYLLAGEQTLLYVMDGV